MIPTTTFNQKRYRAAKERFLKPALIRFIEIEFPQIGGPLVVNLFVDKLLEKIDLVAPLKDRIKPGQMVWNALDQHTRSDHPNRKTMSVILTIVTEEDVARLEAGSSPALIIPDILARLYREAYEQGTLLSTRDVSLIFCRDSSDVSKRRIQYEKKNNCVLPHTGSLHDQGTTLTHKGIICKKVKQEKKDPALVAKETNHSQRSVDKYLKGYERVKALQMLGKPKEEIAFLTGMSQRLVKQYDQLIKELG